MFTHLSHHNTSRSIPSLKQEVCNRIQAWTRLQTSSSVVNRCQRLALFKGPKKSHGERSGLYGGYSSVSHRNCYNVVFTALTMFGGHYHAGE
ncbi:hypothetical protein TNCV_1441921 [Trichonephila clavipes]|uniref:Uncharacterized protein n=1 Tax=Trichonephila clavipes TaxID=2585209 RepID=A0A8X6RKC3_TRICX|nr:hypothetical protein TNCV_1441921 [Trichonephila clavipes]